MVTVMKKMNITSKILALALAALMVLSLASCDAKMNEASDMLADGNGGAMDAPTSSGNSYPYYSAEDVIISNPSYDVAEDAEMDEGMVLPEGAEEEIELERVPGEENNYIENPTPWNWICP